MRFLGKLFKLIIIVFLALLLIGLGYYFAVTKDVRLSEAKLTLKETSVLLYDDKNERIFMPCTSEIEQTVAFEDLPTHTVRAFIDTEDKRFFSHNGYDFKRIVKAAWNNLKARSFQQGASTISQQLIKNTHLSQEKTLKRKLQEWKLTKQLEKKHSKEEILEKYLSVIYFGHSCFGLRSAAEFYFGKSPQELDIAQSAILAGLVKSPNNYSPFKNPENCQKRKTSVLNAMLKNGSIDKADYQKAKDEPLPLAPMRDEGIGGYTQQVFDELSAIADERGFTVGGNIQIYTYLDKELQFTLTEIATAHEESDKQFCVLDAHSHGFKACVSTVGETQRLPGSLLKPLLVYAPAMEENFLSPATPILDEKINYGGYSPDNYDGNFHSYVSAREALAKSLNVPAVKVLESVGVERAVSYLQKLRLPVDKKDYSLALALGGMQRGYSLQRLLSAYSALACSGNYTSCGFIQEIKIDGNTVYKKSDKQERVFSDETAYLTTDMLQTAAKTGTAKKLHSLPFSIAAKTGTVGTKNGNTDAYALSYTTRDVVGVWLGNADNTLVDYTGGGLPCNYLLQINAALQTLYENERQTIEDFSRPKNVVNATLDVLSYEHAHSLELADEIAPAQYKFMELFKKDNLPQKRADYFSSPRISTPSIALQDGYVVLTFSKDTPDFYEFLIERTNGKKKTVLYRGNRIERFVDDNIVENEQYVYSVTPIYNEKSGQSIVLPTVSTRVGEKIILEDKKILEKNWWEE